jgi:hypothetical protein
MKMPDVVEHQNLLPKAVHAAMPLTAMAVLVVNF